MPHLFGKFYGKRELLQYVGRLEQIGGIRRYVLDEGNERGVEQIQVRTGAGLCYYVSPSRGLDIGFAELDGIPLTWQSECGDVHPGYYEPQGIGFLRTFPGGLLHTCGLDTMGSPSFDKGEALGQHGRYSHIPAKQVGAEGIWTGDEYEMKVTGKVRQTRVFGENLELSRTITSRLGENKITVRDRVENDGFVPCEHMILYHCNFGFPFLGPELQIDFPEGSVRGREADMPLEGYDRFEIPTPGYKERVYYHKVDARNRLPSVLLRNPSLGLQIRLTYSADTLPCLVQWKTADQGRYALAIEPANAYVEGRPAERERGTLVTLAPGEALEYELVFEVERTGSE